MYKLYSLNSEDSNGVISITCLICGRTSYNLNDAKHKYCGACNIFLDTPLSKEHLSYTARRSIELREYFDKASKYQELFNNFSFEDMTDEELQAYKPNKNDYTTLSNFEMATIDGMLDTHLLKSLKQVGLIKY